MPKTDSPLRIFKPTYNHHTYLNALKKRKIPFMMRKSPFVIIIQAQNIELVFLGEKREGRMPINQLWLFGAVKRDAINFLKNNPEFVPLNKLPTNVYNKEYDLSKGIITGTDIISAYWTIAYQKGIISPKTYDKASDKKYKVTKLASLAVLGRQMYFDKFDEDGNLTERVVKREANDELRDIYRSIRYECFQHMGHLAMILGEDFFCYKTDCIYYRDIPENRKKVHEYLEQQNFKYSQMIYGESDELPDEIKDRY
jgi:hypothetical protein